jgi:uncharacterized protein YwgA
MKDYWLAKLISSVDEVDSRKRLQKSIYLLQLAGCPLQCDYLLHYYGPYSFELAALIDQLDGAGIIKETQEQLAPGVTRYRSSIEPKGKQVLSSFEQTETGRQIHHEIQPFIQQFKELNQQDVPSLELAATAAYFYDGNWEEAKNKAATFKAIHQNDDRLLQAIRLAKGFAGTQ